MTQAAMFDSDFNVLGAERSGVNGFEHHRLFRRLGDPCLVVPRHWREFSTTAPAGLSRIWVKVVMAIPFCAVGSAFAEIDQLAGSG